jgi:hypothetical protein
MFTVLTLTGAGLQPFPWPDRGGCITTVPNADSFRAVHLAFDKIGQAPPKQMNTLAADRGVWQTETTVDMIDLQKPGMRGNLKDIYSSYQRTVSNPIADANTFASALVSQGFAAEVIENPDPAICTGSLAIVRSNAFPYTSFSFRKNVFNMCIQPK